MSKTLKEVVIPASAFFVGVVLHALVVGWIEHKDPLLVALTTVAITLLVIVVLFAYLMSFVEKGFRSVDLQLIEATRSAGLSVEYVEDGDDGASYERAADLIRRAESTVTFVDYWAPYREYQVHNDGVLPKRESFYTTVKQQLEAHKHDKKTFHRRIVQVPADLFGMHIPFETDPAFLDYLTFAAKLQELYPNSCRLKCASSRIKLPFIMVDRRFVVLPILTSDSGSKKQTRHGALVFDDRQGTLVDCLTSIYRTLDAHATPVESEQLMSTRTKTVEERARDERT